MRYSRVKHWAAVVCSGGIVMQFGCPGLGQDLGVTQNTILNSIVFPQIAGVVSDTLFFILDNAFVRLTT